VRLRQVLIFVIALTTKISAWISKGTCCIIAWRCFTESTRHEKMSILPTVMKGSVSTRLHCRWANLEMEMWRLEGKKAASHLCRVSLKRLLLTMVVRSRRGQEV